MRVTVKLPILIVISSDGIAAEKAGYCLGQFEYDEDLKCFSQSSTEKDSKHYEPKLVYQDNNNGDWFVAAKGYPHKPGGWLKNTIMSATVPTKGWKVYAPNGDEFIDHTLTGPLDITCE